MKKTGHREEREGRAMKKAGHRKGAKSAKGEAMSKTNEEIEQIAEQRDDLRTCGKLYLGEERIVSTE
jgi:hypothetical protein